MSCFPGTLLSTARSSLEVPCVNPYPRIGERRLRLEVDLGVVPDLDRGQQQQRREGRDPHDVGDETEQEPADQHAGDRSSRHDDGEPGLLA
jgi:hypothetical protein